VIPLARARACSTARSPFHRTSPASPAAYLQNALDFAFHPLSYADAVVAAQQQCKADVVTTPPHQHPAPCCTIMRHPCNTLLARMTGALRASAEFSRRQTCQSQLVYPLAPLTKASTVPIGASLFSPSTIASPSPTKRTCSATESHCRLPLRVTKKHTMAALQMQKTAMPGRGPHPAPRPSAASLAGLGA
jgi:hypothetical protein